MKKLTNSALWVLYLSIFALISCNDPTVIGSDLLSGDQLDIEFIDTLTLKAKTVPNDSLVVWRTGTNSVILSNFALGDFQDPIFGRTVSSIYTQFFTNTSRPNFDPTKHTLDSVVLLVPLNASLSYGNLDETYTVEVYEMSDVLNAKSTYTNFDSFAVNPAPLATHSFIPNFTDSITVMEPSSDTVREVRLPAHLRIKLDNAAMSRILSMDSLTINVDSNFVKSFKGLWLKPASQNKGMLSLNMRSSTQTNLRFYYTESGTKKKSYDFHSFSGNPIVLHQQNYYGGSIAGDFLNTPNSAQNDSLIFLQGLNGVNFELEIPYAEDLNGIIINKAELILPILSLPGDIADITPVAQMYATEYVSDTSLIVIDDIYLPIRNLSTDDFGKYFGGKAGADDIQYKISLSAHMQKMIAGKTTKTLRFTVNNRTESPTRVVLGGPSHSEFPAKLRISYTKY
ncbi:MAG: DUF4270 family protein [Saprospiraceae bacterium]|nr:DUF4270 family protein [Saprospiraceae bacterium]